MSEFMSVKLDPESITYCNCAQCGCLLTGEKTARHVWAMTDEWPVGMAPPVYVRVGGRFGRPLCEAHGKHLKKNPAD